MDGEEEDTSQKLHNMMSVSDEMSYDYLFASEYVHKRGIFNRTNAVNWMKHCVEQVLGADCPTIRDTSIQIFDKFLLFSSSEDPNILDNTEYISYSAAAAVLLGAKITDTNSDITMAKFSDSHFDVDHLIKFEQHVLAVTCCKISPLCTPSSFLHLMMDLNGNIDRRETVLKNADLLIAEFWGEPASLLYAPSTIAITALLLSFSLLKIPCGSLLRSLPLCCFLSPDNPFFDCSVPGQGTCPDGEVEEPSSPNSRFLDYESCIAAFQSMEVMRNYTYQRAATPLPPRAETPSPCGDGAAAGCGGLGASPVSVATQLESPCPSPRSKSRSSPRSSSPRASPRGTPPLARQAPGSGRCSPRNSPRSAASTTARVKGQASSVDEKENSPSKRPRCAE